MTINWKEVLEIETYLTNEFEQNTTIERFLWRHPQTINTGLRVDKLKRYSFDDLQNYLTTKFPKDEMIKKGTKMTMNLFQACASGMQLCEIDEELLDINENQESYRLSTEILKIHLFNQSAEYTGSTSFFLYCLKNIVDAERNSFEGSAINKDIKERITYSFLGYINQLGKFQPEKFGLNPENCICDIICSDFIKETFKKLKDKTNEFMTDSRFTSFGDSCEQNNYTPPYANNDNETFLHDSLTFSISEVIEIINQDTENYFAFKLRQNESPYPEDLRESNYGNLNVFVTLFGLVNFNRIVELKNNDELLSNIKKIFSNEFIILPRESINDDYNPNVTYSGKGSNSTFIIGKHLIQKKLYNQHLDSFQEKVIKGFVWYNDDVHGVIYSYLNFSDKTDNTGVYIHSIPFENVIFKYLIAYLNWSSWEREMEDDLKDEGYWDCKEQYEKEMSGEYDEDWDEKLF